MGIPGVTVELSASAQDATAQGFSHLQVVKMALRSAFLKDHAPPRAVAWILALQCVVSFFCQVETDCEFFLTPMVADSSTAAASSADVRKEPFAYWLRWFSLSALVVLITDLASKYVMFGPLADAAMPSWIRLAYNRGVAWSLFDELPWLVVGLTVVLIPVLVAVWWRQFRCIGRWENLAFGSILGGALGNAYDRINMHFGHLEGVRDFIHVDLGFWPFHPYPTFNVADSGICVGFIILVLLSFRKSA